MRLSNIFAIIAVVITGGILLYGVSDFPSFGDPKSPANAAVPGSESVSQYFITKLTTGAMTRCLKRW